MDVFDASDTAEHHNRRIAFELLHASLLAFQRDNAPNTEREANKNVGSYHVVPVEETWIRFSTLPAKLN